ncbi:MAG: ATP-dependent DNA helicase [Candidatus Pacebacteria bacterium]|nr:ATP-dependent DNA helicase [Candidatus Paceibacterota bacterium]
MSNFDDRYAGLNERQKEAVNAIDGPVMVIAGPGSGKTELLGLRVANILRKTDAAPEDILCLTFTDSAAKNMRERLAGLIGKDAYKVAIHTFHSFGSEIINRHPECFYQGAVYSPIDEISKMEMIEKIIKDLKWSSRLKSFHPDQGFTYLRDIIGRIDDIKKGGLTPEEFESLVLENKKFEDEADEIIKEVFCGRISLAMIPDLEKMLSRLSSLGTPERKFSLGNYSPLKDVIIDSLEKTLGEVAEIEEKKSKTKPVTRWKKNFLKKNVGGEWLLESNFRNKDLLDLAKIYSAYQEKIHQGGFYDFADMILDTVRELEQNAELRYELQEKFLYVLVDEFQDTSGVQMRLMDAVLNTEVNEGRPNILVVGDDDQSIFKFQGANLQNFSGFLKKYKSVEKIVLTENYRSTQEILDYSQGVVGQVAERLANRESGIVKELVAANAKIEAGKIVQKEFASKVEQYIFIIEEIKKSRSENIQKDIAVISRKHGDLVEMARFFNFYGIPVAYERGKNILEERHISEIIIIAKFINSLNRKGREEADEYLPDILSFPFFAVDRIDIWKISTLANRSRGKTWLEIMLEYGGAPKQVADFLIALGAEAKIKTMEEILDFITGNKKIESVGHKSNFKEYYFSKENFDSGRLEYLEHLSDLETLFRGLRAYRSKETLFIKDLVDFIEIHETHKLPIYGLRRLREGESAVTLLTAHKAKGLEFDSVFIVNCNEDSWMRSRGGSKLSFPANIPLSAEKDSVDDKIRLFFVAVTRAKSNLCLTNYSMAEGEKKSSERLRFLDENLATEEIEALTVETIKNREELLLLKEEVRRCENRNADEEELLRSLLDDYKLSVTHLNNFLDVSAGGPMRFLEQNLLRFPAAPSSASSYGTAIHNSFSEFYKRFKERGVLPELEEFLMIFKEKLKMQKLNKKDFVEKLEQGEDELSFYYKESVGIFSAGDLLAVNFKSEGVMIGECPVTGEIDRMSLEEKSKIVKVYDYKTGKPFVSWAPSDDYLKIKAYKYKDQLVFYKLLLENSRSFGKFEVVSGGIDFIAAPEDELIKLELEISDEDIERLKSLVAIVYKKIMTLDFPDTSKYSANFKGMQEFEDDLLSDRI